MRFSVISVRFACFCSWRDHRPSPRCPSSLISWRPKAKSQINGRGASSGLLPHFPVKGLLFDDVGQRVARTGRCF